MAQPIYKYFQGAMTEAWYQLSTEEQQALLAQVDAKLAEVGGKSVVMCDASWAAEPVQFWGVEVYPDIEAVQKVSQFHMEINWFRYVNSQSLLGTEWQSPF